MKPLHLSAAISVGLALSSCKVPVQPVQPVPEPQPVTPTPPPAPTPAAQIPPPEPATSPDATAEKSLYVIKRFTVKIGESLHGFAVGKKVTLLREEAGTCTVTDGTAEGNAPKEYFTADPNAADAVADIRKQREQAAREILDQRRKILDQQQADEAENHARNIDARETTQKQKRIAALEAAIHSLGARINQAQRERASKGYPKDGGPRYRDHLPYSDRSVALSVDASQIEALLQARSRMEAELRMLKSSP